MQKNYIFTWKRVLGVLALLILPIVADAANYYVSPRGSNTGKGTQVSPFLTIAQAAQMARAGDTVFVAGGIYSEMNIKPKSSGSQSGGYIVYCPLPQSGKVCLTKSDNSTADNDTPIMDLTGLSYIWIEGFEFTGMLYLSGCISMNQSSHCVITKNSFCSLGNQEVAPDWGGDAMVRLYNSTDCVVSNNYFSDIYGDGIDFVGQKTKRNLICENTFVNLKGKKRSWAEDKYKYSSAVTGTDSSYGDNVICFNHITGGQDGIWLDRDASRNIVLRNMGTGGQRLVFNESRCAYNWILENVACNMTEAGYRSALYDGTGWTFDTRWVNNVAFNCKKGFHMHKSKHNEVRNNIAYGSSEYSVVLTDSASKYGQNVFRNNLWYAPSKSTTIQYKGKAITPQTFANQIGETGGIYGKSPKFLSTSKPYDFELQTSSPCLATGDGGVDVGAYPVYPATVVGCDATRLSHPSQPSFTDLVTEVIRGESYPVTVSLLNPSTETVSVKLRVVAGDIREGVDFVLSDSLLTFLPGETEKSVEVSFFGDESEFAHLLALKLVVDDEHPTDARGYALFKLITREEYDKMQRTDIWLEAEGGNVGSLWLANTDSRASDKKYVTVKSGNNSSNSAPVSESGWISYTIDVTVANTYVLWMRTLCPNANDDSFWLRMDNDSWSRWNDIPTSSAWTWNQCSKTFNLSEGIHTFYIGYREDGAKIDKLLFTCNQTVPTGLGGEDITAIAPVYDNLGDALSTFYIYNMQGQQICQVVARQFDEAVNTAGLSPDIYIVKRVSDKGIEIRKMIKY